MADNDESGWVENQEDAQPQEQDDSDIGTVVEGVVEVIEGFTSIFEYL